MILTQEDFEFFMELVYELNPGQTEEEIDKIMSEAVV